MLSHLVNRTKLNAKWVYPNRVTCWYLLFLGSMMCVKPCVHLFQLQWHSWSSTSLTFSQWQRSTHSLATVCTHVLVKHNRSHLPSVYLQLTQSCTYTCRQIISNDTFSSVNIKQCTVYLIVLKLWFSQRPESGNHPCIASESQLIHCMAQVSG